MHNGMLQLNGEKMSKSLGNVIPLKEIISSRRAGAFRIQVLQTHYRAPLNFTRPGLEAAESGLSRLRSAAAPMTDERAPQSVSVGDPSIGDLAATIAGRFHDAMLDDFNTPAAVASLFELGRAINRAKAEGTPREPIETAQAVLRELAGIIGIELTDASTGASRDATPFIDLLVTVRDNLRANRQFEMADLIRSSLLDKGIVLEDNPAGTSWKRRPDLPDHD